MPAHPSALIARVPPLRRQLRILDYYLTLDEERVQDDKMWQRISGCGAQDCIGSALAVAMRSPRQSLSTERNETIGAFRMLWGRVLTRVCSSALTAPVVRAGLDLDELTSPAIEPTL